MYDSDHWVESVTSAVVNVLGVFIEEETGSKQTSYFDCVQPNPQSSELQRALALAVTGNDGGGNGDDGAVTPVVIIAGIVTIGTVLSPSPGALELSPELRRAVEGRREGGACRAVQPTTGCCVWVTGAGRLDIS